MKPTAWDAAPGTRLAVADRADRGLCGRGVLEPFRLLSAMGTQLSSFVLTRCSVSRAARSFAGIRFREEDRWNERHQQNRLLRRTAAST